MNKQNNSLEPSTLLNRIKNWLYNLLHKSLKDDIDSREITELGTNNNSENSNRSKDFLEEFKEKEMKRQYLLDLQLKYKCKQVREDEMSEEDRIGLENLYIEQNNELKRKIRSIDSKIARMSK